MFQDKFHAVKLHRHDGVNLAESHEDEKWRKTLRKS